MDSEVICNPKNYEWLTHLLNNIGLRDASASKNPHAHAPCGCKKQKISTDLVKSLQIFAFGAKEKDTKIAHDSQKMRFVCFHKSFWLIQISLTPGQVATDVCQALEYSTWKAHVHINQRIPTPVSKELLSEDILRMAHTVHSVPLSIFRAQGPPDSLLSSCDPPFWCHGFLCHGDIQIQFGNICRNHISFSVSFNLILHQHLDTKFQWTFSIWTNHLYLPDNHPIQEESAWKLNNLYHSSTGLDHNDPSKPSHRLTNGPEPSKTIESDGSKIKNHWKTIGGNGQTAKKHSMVMVSSKTI